MLAVASLAVDPLQIHPVPFCSEEGLTHSPTCSARSNNAHAALETNCSYLSATTITDSDAEPDQPS